jgi:hypothetical protein
MLVIRGPFRQPQPPVVAAAAACDRATSQPSTQQPVEIAVTEKQGGISAGESYLTKFANLNGSCAPSGSGGPTTDSFTFAPNVTAARATKIAEDMRDTGLFAEVMEMTVPACTTRGLGTGSCTPPTDP